MSKVDDMSDQELEEAALRFHNSPAVHLCEHGHPDHALEPGGPCILDHVTRYLQKQIYGATLARNSFIKILGDGS